MTREVVCHERKQAPQKKEGSKNIMGFSSEETPNRLSLEGMTLRVQNVERSLEFYTKLPGAQVIVHREGHFAMLRIGAGRLGLLQQPSAPLFHLELETPSELETFAQLLRDAGMDHVKVPTQKKWGEFDFTVRDPDGNLLEFESAGQQKRREEHISTSPPEKES
ncbi:MAG: VOC family protein [Chloroflexota bacterium]|nr:VOC family protein [Chloroflexota bacterium]